MLCSMPARHGAISSDGNMRFPLSSSDLQFVARLPAALREVPDPARKQRGPAVAFADGLHDSRLPRGLRALDGMATAYMEDTSARREQAVMGREDKGHGDVVIKYRSRLSEMGAHSGQICLDPKLGCSARDNLPVD